MLTLLAYPNANRSLSQQDWIPVPMVYTQVSAFILLQTFLLCRGFVSGGHAGRLLVHAGVPLRAPEFRQFASHTFGRKR